MAEKKQLSIGHFLAKQETEEEKAKAKKEKGAKTPATGLGY